MTKAPSIGQGRLHVTANSRAPPLTAHDIVHHTPARRFPKSLVSLQDISNHIVPLAIMLKGYLPMTCILLVTIKDCTMYSIVFSPQPTTQSFNGLYTKGAAQFKSAYSP
jgi:hypothetical protein